MVNSYTNRYWSSIPYYLKVLSVLRFLAEGSYQKGWASDLNHPLSQPFVSRALHEVVFVIFNHMADQFIQFPSAPEEKIAVSTNWVFENLNII